MFIAKALSPAEIYSITLNPAMNRAKVVVPDDQLSLAIGKKGQNVRLAAKLTHWDIDVLGKSDAENLAAEARSALTGIEGASESTIDRLVRLGYNLADLAQIDPQSLTGHESVSIEEAEAIVKVAQKIVYEGLSAVRKPEAEPQEEEAEAETQEEGAQQQPTEEEAATEASEMTTGEEQTGEEGAAEEQTGEEEEMAEQPSDSADPVEETDEATDEATNEAASEEADEEAADEEVEQETDSRQSEA